MRSEAPDFFSTNMAKKKNLKVSIPLDDSMLDAAARDKIKELEGKVKRLERELAKQKDLQVKKEIIEDAYKRIFEFVSSMRSYPPFFQWGDDDLD